MSNYFSIGLESRVGLGFEKSRTRSAVTNKCVYTWEGLKKMCCCSQTLKINQVIDYVGTGGHPHIPGVSPDGNDAKAEEEKVLFATRGSHKASDKVFSKAF